MRTGYFDVVVDDKTYEAKCIMHGATWLESSYDFTVKIGEEEHDLNLHVPNEMVRDLSVIYGLDPIDELANIVYEEVKSKIRSILNEQASL